MQAYSRPVDPAVDGNPSPSKKARCRLPGLAVEKKRPSLGSSAGGWHNPSPVLHGVAASFFFPTDLAEYFGSYLYPRQHANAGAPEHPIEHVSREGRCGAISYLHGGSFPEGTIHFTDEQRRFLTNENMNASQPGVQTLIPGTDIRVAIRYQSCYHLSVAHFFRESVKPPGNKTLFNTWVIPALPYSPVVRANIYNLLAQAGQNPVDLLDAEIGLQYTFEYMADPDRPGQYVSARPEDWHHLIWLEPTFVLNGNFLMPPLQNEGGDCWLNIPDQQSLDKLLKILDHFGVGHMLVEDEVEVA